MITPLLPIEISYLEQRIPLYNQLNDHPSPSNRNIIPGAENLTIDSTELLQQDASRYPLSPLIYRGYLDGSYFSTFCFPLSAFSFPISTWDRLCLYNKG